MARPKATDGVNKSELVREAMKALGGDPGPKEIIEYVKSNHNVDLKYTLVASYKSNMKNKGAKGGKRGPKAGGGSVVDLNDLLAVRELLNRVGEPQLQKLITALTAV